MRVIRIGQDEDERWDGYMAPRCRAVTDLSAWRAILREAYGVDSVFLAAVRDHEMAGGLGLYRIRHPLFGHYLVTAPFGNDGGFYFDSPEARDRLVEAARKLADELDVEYLLIRCRGLALDGFAVDRRYRTAILDLSRGAEEFLGGHLGAKTRNQIRRGMKEGFQVSSGPHEMEAFFEVFHRHMRDLGSPGHSLGFYRAVIDKLGERADFVVVRDKRELAAGALLFRVNGVAMNYHTVALRAFNRRCPNYLIYWRMIEASCEKGCREFDMGRSLRDSTVLKFKENWNPEVLELTYNYHLRKLKKPPDLDPRNPLYRLPIAVWRRLPVAVTQKLGPRLITGLA